MIVEDKDSVMACQGFFSLDEDLLLAVHNGPEQLLRLPLPYQAGFQAALNSVLQDRPVISSANVKVNKGGDKGAGKPSKKTNKKGATQSLRSPNQQATEVETKSLQSKGEVTSHGWNVTGSTIDRTISRSLKSASTGIDTLNICYELKVNTDSRDTHHLRMTFSPASGFEEGYLRMRLSSEHGISKTELIPVRVNQRNDELEITISTDWDAINCRKLLASDEDLVLTLSQDDKELVRFPVPFESGFNAALDSIGLPEKKRPAEPPSPSRSSNHTALRTQGNSTYSSERVVVDPKPNKYDNGSNIWAAFLHPTLILTFIAAAPVFLAILFMNIIRLVFLPVFKLIDLVFGDGKIKSGKAPTASPTPNTRDTKTRHSGTKLNPMIEKGLTIVISIIIIVAILIVMGLVKEGGVIGIYTHLALFVVGGIVGSLIGYHSPDGETHKLDVDVHSTRNRLNVAFFYFPFGGMVALALPHVIWFVLNLMGPHCAAPYC
ncbi:MAG: hypothetical protein HN540_17370 [Rhodospirillaceae bacterium]|nr:hypothetical protein [Rhodospirillaceae bacterium]